MPRVAIFMGSLSDEAKMRPCASVLDSLGVAYRFTVTSAHRTPARTEQLVDELEAAGCQVFICGAGMAAHLAGAVAARTMKPVIGVPSGRARMASESRPKLANMASRVMTDGHGREKPSDSFIV